MLTCAADGTGIRNHLNGNDPKLIPRQVQLLVRSCTSPCDRLYCLKDFLIVL